MKTELNIGTPDIRLLPEVTALHRNWINVVDFASCKITPRTVVGLNIEIVYETTVIKLPYIVSGHHIEKTILDALGMVTLREAAYKIIFTLNMDAHRGTREWEAIYLFTPTQDVVLEMESFEAKLPFETMERGLQMLAKQICSIIQKKAVHELTSLQSWKLLMDK